MLTSLTNAHAVRGRPTQNYISEHFSATFTFVRSRIIKCSPRERMRFIRECWMNNGNQAVSKQQNYNSQRKVTKSKEIRLYLFSSLFVVAVCQCFRKGFIGWTLYPPSSSTAAPIESLKFSRSIISPISGL